MTIELIEEHKVNKKKTIIKMRDMKPFDVGIIKEEGKYEGVIVLRTASSVYPEVIVISDPRIDNC